MTADILSKTQDSSFLSRNRSKEVIDDIASCRFEASAWASSCCSWAISDWVNSCDHFLLVYWSCLFLLTSGHSGCRRSATKGRRTNVVRAVAGPRRSGSHRDERP